MSEKPRTVVLLSGGMNSAVMLYDFITFEKVKIKECVIFDAEDAVDLQLARDLCDKCAVPYSMWAYDGMPVVEPMPEDPYLNQPELHRSMLLTTILNHAIHRAHLVGATEIAGGFCGEDLPFSAEGLIGFCLGAGRALEGHLSNFNFPFLNRTKAQIFEHARDLNRLVEVTRDTNSCDLSHDDIQHSWGYGCGSCPGCVRRWKAWDEYLEIIGQGPKA
jgi:7-cyano-7-deazaguanine synthase in queuosine biosynthesis